MSGYDLPGTGFFITAMCIAAFAGWAVIELVLWLFSFITIGLA